MVHIKAYKRKSGMVKAHNRRSRGGVKRKVARKAARKSARKAPKRGSKKRKSSAGVIKVAAPMVKDIPVAS